jgi:hypothetical protein
MFLTTHAAAGILISRYFPEPGAVFGISFASHFLMDFIPHGDTDLYHDEVWKVQNKYRRVVLINALDLVFLVAMVLWVILQPDMPRANLMLIGVIGSVLPDLFSHFFPAIHHRFSWLGVVRWLHAGSKQIGLRFMVRGQNWLHHLFHHRLIHRDISFRAGLVMQLTLVAVMFLLGR